jgi:hypothetical protein
MPCLYVLSWRWCQQRPDLKGIPVALNPCMGDVLLNIADHKRNLMEVQLAHQKPRQGQRRTADDIIRSVQAIFNSSLLFHSSFWAWTRFLLHWHLKMLTRVAFDTACAVWRGRDAAHAALTWHKLLWRACDAACKWALKAWRGISKCVGLYQCKAAKTLGEFAVVWVVLDPAWLKLDMMWLGLDMVVQSTEAASDTTR